MSEPNESAGEITVRPYVVADRAAVAEITASSWVGVTMAELREQKVGKLDGRGWQEHKTAAVLQSIDNDPARVLVAVAGATVIGYATFRVSGEVGTVADNAVHPDWQGRGVGTRLIASVLDELRGSGVRLLEVTTFEHDGPARAVYEKFGFEPVASSVHYSMDVAATSARS